MSPHHARTGHMVQYVGRHGGLTATVALVLEQLVAGALAGTNFPHIRVVLQKFLNVVVVAVRAGSLQCHRAGTESRIGGSLWAHRPVDGYSCAEISASYQPVCEAGTGCGLRRPGSHTGPAVLHLRQVKFIWQVGARVCRNFVISVAAPQCAWVCVGLVCCAIGLLLWWLG